MIHMPPIFRRHFEEPTFELTRIKKMICKSCRQTYTKDTGFPVHEGILQPCTGMPANIFAAREHCECTQYDIYYNVNIRAMPMGNINTDLSRKRS